MKLTIHLLHDDQPTGARIAKIDQWSGRAVCAPRSALDEVLRRSELDGPCLYFLIAQPPGRNAPRVYVGEADGFRDRIRTHHLTKDWWTSLVVFFSADGSLTKSGIQYLESVSIRRLRDAGWCQMDNGTDPRLPTVPEEDVGGLTLFGKNVEILMPVLGYDIFAKAPADEAGESVSVEAEPIIPRTKDFDTIVCPARQDGFEKAFLGQRAWWAIRIGEQNLPKIKFIAMYQSQPISAITHYGEVDRIEPYTGEDEAAGKYKLFLKGEPVVLPNPVKLGKNVHLKPQGPKYAKLDDILKAHTIDDVFYGS
jgi:hypothetical protein